MKKPLVGIFLPVGLFQPGLVGCIEALIKQTFRDWRCLIVADNPNKEFLDYLLTVRKGDNRFDLLFHNYMTKDIVRLKNIGLQYWDTTPFIMYLTDDLIMNDDCIDKMVTVLKQHPEFGVISPSLTPPNPFTNQFICVGVLWTKEAIDKTGVIDIEFAPRFEEEHDHMLRLVNNGFSPHRVTNAMMTHNQVDGGSMKKIAGDKFTEPRTKHKRKISQKYKKSNNQLEREILNFPTIEAKKVVKIPEVAWLASNIPGNIDGGCMVSCINLILGLKKMGVDIKPYKFPYKAVLKNALFDNDVSAIKNLIDMNKASFDSVERDKVNVKCDILIEYHGPPQPMNDWDKHCNIMWTTWDSTHIYRTKTEILHTADE